MDEREELFKLWLKHGTTFESDSSEGHELVEAILAAGYRKAATEPEYQWGIKWDGKDEVQPTEDQDEAYSLWKHNYDVDTVVRRTVTGSWEPWSRG